MFPRNKARASVERNNRHDAAMRKDGSVSKETDLWK